MISTAFDYSRATSLDDALAKLRAANGGGKLIAGGHSLVPLMKLRLSEPQDADRHRAHPGPVRHPREGRQDRDRRRHRAPRRRLVRAAAAGVSRCSPKPRRTIGDPQVRNRGTLGGSLAHADPVGRLPGGDARARRRDPRQGPERLAGGEGARFLPGPVHRRSGAGRDHRRRAVHAGEVRGLRQAASARVALRHRRRRGGARTSRTGRFGRRASA